MLLKIAARKVLEALDPIARWRYRLSTGFHRPIPPMRFRARTASRWVQRFVESGKACADALANALHATTGQPIYDFDPVLDFGCGCGRTLLYWDLPRFRQLVGCDVDHEAIEWLRRSYPPTKYTNLMFEPTLFDPPLPYGTGHFALVYSVSIFSHLSTEDQLPWLEELARITRPGGIALITVQGHVAVKKFAEWRGAAWSRQWGRHDLEKENFVFLAVPPKRGATPAPGVASSQRVVQYGLTFMTRRHIDQHWNRGPWTVLDVHEGTLDQLQDVVVLQRNGG